MTELEKTTIEVAKLIQNLSADDCFEVINRALQIKDDFILVPIWIVGAIAHNMNADKAGGRGTWNNNPLVWAYSFELVD